MKISDFTLHELNLLREQCNFTDTELKCFELKAKDCTDVQLALSLNMSESNISAIMRKVRSKITNVLSHNARHGIDETQSCGCNKCIGIVFHTMAEWARIPDFLSKKGTLYVYADYRTDNEISIPRLKIGDGIHSISEIPFATMAITDEDMEYWDDKPDIKNNDFGKIMTIDKSYTEDNKFIFPSDGYLMLQFKERGSEFATVKIFGASGNSYFTFSKHTDDDNQSKEVYVRKGMMCQYVSASEFAEIKFVPLV